MKITHYSFGKITINGTAYTSDVIIYPARVDSHWWRDNGHLLKVSDLTDVIAAKPAVLIIGTGYYGENEMRTVLPAPTLFFLNFWFVNLSETYRRIFPRIKMKQPVDMVHI